MVISGDPVRVTRNGRRYFSRAHKEAVIAKCLAPGASLAAVALANGFNANLVRKWVRQRLAREASGKSDAKLLPVTIEPARTQDHSERTMAAPVRAAECGSIEIRMGTMEVVLRGVVDRGQLSEVLRALVRSR